MGDFKEIKKIIDTEKIFTFKNDKENFEFEKMCINADFMSVINKLMRDKNISKKQLARKLKISLKKLELLFSCDEFIDIDLIVKLQRIFNKKLIITTK